MRSKVLLIILLIVAAPDILSGQSADLYQRGSILLPNSDKTDGYIWLASEVDGTMAVFFKKNYSDMPIKYNAFEVVSFELKKDARFFQSIEVPVNYSLERRLAELHFDGEYKLFSLKQDKDKIFYLSDKTGKMTELLNTYNLPSATNNYEMRYNYEYRDKLTAIFSDYPEILKSINTLEYNKK